MKKLEFCLLLALTSSAFSTESIYQPTEREVEAVKLLLVEDIHYSIEGGGSLCSPTKFCTEYEVTTAEGLEKTYSDNELRGDKKFKNKEFRVNGVVGSIESGLGDKPYIVFKTKSFNSPQAHFVKSEEDKLIDLNKNQKISLICTGDGEIAGTPILKKCRFVKTVEQEYADKALNEFEMLKNGKVDSVSDYIRYVSFYIGVLQQVSNDFKNCKKITTECLDKLQDKNMKAKLTEKSPVRDFLKIDDIESSLKDKK